jgi:hypothetical protein
MNSTASASRTTHRPHSDYDDSSVGVASATEEVGFGSSASASSSESSIEVPVVTHNNSFTSLSLNQAANQAKTPVPNQSSTNDVTSETTHGATNALPLPPRLYSRDSSEKESAIIDNDEPVVPCIASSALRAVGEYLWQTAGRVANVAVFVGLAGVDKEVLRPWVTVAGAVAGGSCGYRLLKSRIGTETRLQQAAVLLGTAASAAAGGAVAGFGWAAPGVALGAGGVVTLATSLVNRMRHQSIAQSLAHTEPGSGGACSATASNSHVPEVASFFITALPLTVGLYFVPGTQTADLSILARRNLAIMSEASVIELLKAATERIGPTANRDRLNLERKLLAALIGLAPYVISSIVFNGIFGNLLRAQLQSNSIPDLLTPMLIGALANVVKGAVNSAAIRAVGGAQRRCFNSDNATLRASEGLNLPYPKKVLPKIALRYALIACRDALYLSLREKQLNDMAAACVASGIYAVFAQNRDIILDLMDGEHWTEPQIMAKPVALPQTNTLTAEVSSSSSVPASAESSIET